MNCACITVDHDDGYSTLLSDHWQKARKAHKCGECHRKILPGEEYRREVIKWEGEISAHKTCSDCESLKKVFFCGSYIFGNVWEDFQDNFENCFEDMQWLKLSELTLDARYRVFKMIEECWDEEDDD